MVFLFFVHPIYLTPSTEEMQRGSIALTFLNTLDLKTLWQYRPDNYAGGYYLNTLLTALFFKWFPINGFVLKLPPVLYALGAFLIWFHILRKWISDRAAFFFGILSCFPMFYILSFDVNNLGDHAETRLFSALSVYLYLKAREGKRVFFYAASLSFVSGFGTWFAYIFSITPAAIMLHWIFEKQRLNLRLLISCVLAFLAGFSPWIVSNLLTGGAGFYVDQFSFVNLFNIKYLYPHIFMDPFKNLIKKTYASMDYYDRSLQIQFFVFMVRYGLSALLLIVAGKYWYSKTKMIFPASPIVKIIALYTALLILAIEMCEMGGVRFWVPLRPFFIAGIAIVLDWVYRSLKGKPRGWLCFGSLTLLVSTGMISAVSRMNFSLKGSLFQRRGHSAFEVISDSQALFSTKPYKKNFHLQDIRYGSEYFLNMDLAGFQDFQTMKEYLIGASPTAVRSFCYFGGRWLSKNQRTVEEFPEWVQYLKSLEPRAEELIQKGILHEKSIEYLDPSETIESVLAETRTHTDIPKQAWRYAGRKAAQIWLKEEFSLKHVSERFMEYQKSFSAEEQYRFAEGIGSHLLHRYSLGEGGLLNWKEMRLFPRESWLPLLSGIKTRCYRKDILYGLEGRAGLCWMLTDIANQLSFEMKSVLKNAPEDALEFLSPQR